MYTNYNIPQKSYYKPGNFKNTNNYPMNYNSDDRFFGGFLAPFLLGGVGGYVLGRPNYNNNYNNGLIPVYFPPNQPVPYSNTNIYY